MKMESFCILGNILTRSICSVVTCSSLEFVDRIIEAQGKGREEGLTQIGPYGPPGR